MNTTVVVILEVISNQPTQMGFVQDDHVVQEFPATAPYPALRHPVLPGTAISGSDQLTAKVAQPQNLPSRSRTRYLGARFSGKASRSCCTIQVSVGCPVTLKCAMAPAVADHEEAVKHPEGRGGHGEKVHGGDGLTMVLEKAEPALAESGGGVPCAK